MPTEKPELATDDHSGVEIDVPVIKRFLGCPIADLTLRVAIRSIFAEANISNGRQRALGEAWIEPEQDIGSKSLMGELERHKHPIPIAFGHLAVHAV